VLRDHFRWRDSPVGGSAAAGGVDALAHLVDGLADQTGPPGEELDLLGVQAVLADVETDVGDGHAEDVDADQQADDHPEDPEAVGDRLPDGDDEDGVQQVPEDGRDLLAEERVSLGVAGRGLGVGVVEPVLELADLDHAERGVDRAQEDHEQLTEGEAVLGDLAGVVLPGDGGDVEPQRGRNRSGDDVEHQADGAEERQQSEQAEADRQNCRSAFAEVGLRDGGRRRGLVVGRLTRAGNAGRRATVRVVLGHCLTPSSLVSVRRVVAVTGFPY
jgi:hypothetical protein